MVSTLHKNGSAAGEMQEATISDVTLGRFAISAIQLHSHGGCYQAQRLLRGGKGHILKLFPISCEHFLREDEPRDHYLGAVSGHGCLLEQDLVPFVNMPRPLKCSP